MLKTLLGIADLEQDQARMEKLVLELEDELDDVKSRQSAIGNELEEIHDILEDKVSDPDLRDRIEDVVQELEFIEDRGSEDEAEFSTSEKQIIQVLFHTDGFLGAGDIAEEIGKSSGTVRKYMSMLKEKLELSTRKDGRKTLYRLPTQVQDEIIEGSRSITLSE